MKTENSRLTFDLEHWAKLAKVGTDNAVSGLSQMVNRDFKITALDIEEVSLRNAAALVGKKDDKVVGIYLLFSGNASGHILLAFQEATAYELVDMAMGSSPGSTKSLGEMERSVLGEMGNIVGAFFLNGVADSVGARMMPSPPKVVENTAGVVIGEILAKAFQKTESLFVIKLLFSSDTKSIDGRFLVLPSFEATDSVTDGETP